MDIKTRSGIYINIGSDGSSRILSFDKPIRAIELTLDESFRVGKMLAMTQKTGITTELRKLAVGKFFNVARSFREIKEELRQKEITVKSASLNTILKRMIERHELVRDGTEGAYLYRRP